MGQIVSGVDQEQKNIDQRIAKGRNALFSLLGPAFQYKCLLNPKVKQHIFKTYISPILRSGLSSFALRSTHLKSLTLFHRKVMRGILNLSKTSNTPALHFLLSEIPIEGQIHRDIFALFYSIWSNPNSKIYQIVKYLLEISEPNSRTWSTHLIFLTKKYGLEDPLESLRKDPPNKSIFKETVMTKITAFYEKELRESAKVNNRMKYFDVSLLSLRGQTHYALSNIETSHDAQKCRPHLKMLSGDYLTYEIKSSQSGGSAHCRCCNTADKETISHILSECEAYSDTRSRILEQIEHLLNLSNLDFTEIFEDKEYLTQFILDPTSMNLPYRLNQNNSILTDLVKLTRDLCFAIHSSRTKILKEKTEKTNKT